MSLAMKKILSILLAVICMMGGMHGFAQSEAPQLPTSECTVAEGSTAPDADAAAPAETPAQTANATEEKAEPTKDKSFFCGTIWALAPALLAIVLALITKEVYSSLFAGIVLGACFVTQFSPLETMDFVVNTGLVEAISTTGGIFLFLVLLGAFVCMVNKIGAAEAFGRWAQKHIKSRVGSQLATFFLGILIFIDDYFNCLTVGSVMMPITDAKRVSRAKLAYIIDATAAPVCMIAPISSWAAAVSQYSDGTGYNGLDLFIQAIPYNFYSLLSLCFVVALILARFDFGPMRRHEQNAIRLGDVHTEPTNKPEHQEPEKAGHRCQLWDLLLPVILLIVLCTYALVHVGGFTEGKSFAEALSDTDATVGLPWGALLTLILSMIYFRIRGLLTFRGAMRCIPKGFNAMVPAILILALATALKNVTTALEAREFIAFYIEHSATGLVHFLPAVIFLVAALLAFSTGTSWATFGILIPIVVSTFDPTSPLLFIGMSACLAGAVCGDHCSPISDTTIMSSAGAQCDHLSHVSTQLPYVLCVAAISFLGFLLAGFIHNWFIVFPITLAALLLMVFCLKKFYSAKTEA